MAQDDLDEYESLLDLKNQIDARLDYIKENADEKTLEKMTKTHGRSKEKDQSELGEDADKNINKVNKSNKGLGLYQRFLKAFESDMDFDPGRLMGLTDGIFGMVMTLLIFGMGLPEIELLTAGDFASFFYSLIPNIGITLVSFILIASFWLYHHEFIKIKSFNIPFLWLNIFFLASISFIPFSTSIIGFYSRFFLAEVIFGFNIFMTLLFFLLIYWYANHRSFNENEISEHEKKYTYNTFIIIMALTIVVNLLDYHVSSNFIYLFFLVPVISTIRDIMFKMKS